MKKKSLLLLSIVLGMVVSCRPVDRPDVSSVEPSEEFSSNVDSSGDISAYSEEPASDLPPSEEPYSELPSSEEPYSEEPQSVEPTSDEPTSEEPSSEEPSSEEPSSEEPSSEEPSSEEPSSEEPSSEEPSSEPEHEHHWSSTWSYNEEQHWKECTDPDCHEIDQLGNHTYTSSVVTPATYDAPGLKRYTCTVCGYHYDKVIPQKEHQWSSSWSHDENKHWHACTDQGYTDLKKDEAAHTFGTPVFVSDEDLATYRKGYNVYTCSVCGYEKQEVVYYTMPQMAELMNAHLDNYAAYDPFDARDELIENSFPVMRSTSEDYLFAYDLDNDEIIIYDNGDEVGNIVVFAQKEVSNVTDLEKALKEIDAGTNYSSIVLTSNLQVEAPISVNAAHPVDLNLNEYTIDNLQNNEAAIKITKGNTNEPVVLIRNGAIRTKEISGFDMTKSPSCVKVVDAESVRLENLDLINRAERGYAYIDYPDYRGDAKVLIRDCNISSTLVAICIQANDNVILSNNIVGVVLLNSGKTQVLENTIDVTNIQKGMDQEATRLIYCAELYNVCNDLFKTEGYDTYMLTSTDSILIYDRRSINGTFPSPEVTITDNTLMCKKGADNAPYGYGIRYMDLAFDTSIATNAFESGKIVINDNTYSYCLEGGPFNTAGGYYIYKA